MAVTAVRLEGGAGREALWKLGGLEGEAATAMAALPTVPALNPLFDAYRGRSPVTFGYRGETRHVDPWGIVFRRGHWYVVGHDHDRGESRSFRIDRVEGDVEVGAPGGFEPPAGLEPGTVLRDDPWQYGDDESVTARLRVDATQAGPVAEQVGEEAVVERADDGGIVVELPVTNVAAFRSFVLGLLDAAEVLGPPAVRDDVRRLARGDRGWGRREPAPAAGSAPAPRARAGAVDRGPSRRVPRGDRGALRCRRAGARRDLQYLPMCGLPPYTPDRLIDVEIVDGHVWIRFAEYFARPLRLSAEEGLGLLAAGRALLAVPGSDEHGTLATALDTLAAALGASEGLAVEVGEPAALDVLRTAAAAHERVEIDYYSFGRDALTTRRIDLNSVFHAFGHWYADAYCHEAQDERLFRVDRIRAVRPTGEHHDPPTDEAVVGESVYHPRPEDPRVELELDPDAAWVVESYPHEEAEARPDGSWRVVLAISELAFLERLLLRLGPAVRVLGPIELQQAGPAAARRLLDRYLPPSARVGG